MVEFQRKIYWDAFFDGLACFSSLGEGIKAQNHYILPSFLYVNPFFSNPYRDCEMLARDMNSAISNYSNGLGR